MGRGAVSRYTTPLRYFIFTFLFFSGVEVEHWLELEVGEGRSQSATKSHRKRRAIKEKPASFDRHGMAVQAPLGRLSDLVILKSFYFILFLATVNMG